MDRGLLANKGTVKNKELDHSMGIDRKRAARQPKHSGVLRSKSALKITESEIDQEKRTEKHSGAQKAR